MTFKVPALREEIGNPLDMYSVNHDILTKEPLFRSGGKEIRLLLGGRGQEDCELDLESSDLMVVQIMR